MKFHEIEPERIYCGMAALVATTGLPFQKIRYVVNCIVNNPPAHGVRGMSIHTLVETLRNFDVQCDLYRPFHDGYGGLGRLTLKQWLTGEKLERMLPDTRYIIHLTNHYVCILNGVLFDNHSRYGETALESKWLRKQIKSIIVIKEEKTDDTR